MYAGQGLIGRDMRLVTARQELNFGRSTAGLEVVTEGDDRQQDRGQQDQRDELHRYAGQRGVRVTASDRDEPRTEQGNGYDYPDEIGKEFEDY